MSTVALTFRFTSRATSTWLRALRAEDSFECITGGATRQRELIVGAPGGTEGQGTVMQGYTEQSNVSVVDEFINMITSQRAYEANSKVVKAADEMYQQANNLKQ